MMFDMAQERVEAVSNEYPPAAIVIRFMPLSHNFLPGDQQAKVQF